MEGLQLLVLLGVTIVAGTAVARAARVTPSLVLLVAGVALGFVPGLEPIELEPEVVLVLFLPAILYWESLTTSLREIRANLRPILLLAVGLVILTAGSVAVIGHALGLSWPMAFVLGAALAPTDITAVAAVAGRLPRRTLTTLHAESLINDGTALVLYAVAVSVAVGESEPSAWNVSWRLVASYVGGIVVGLAVTYVVRAARQRVHDGRLENGISVVTPFAAFLPAELLHVSGVVAVVVCGLALSQYGPRQVAARTRLQAIAFWGLATFLLNGALFVLVGLQLRGVLDDLTSTTVVGAAGAGLLVALAVIGTRMLWLYTVPYLVRLVDRREVQRSRRVGARQRFPIAWAGFRGAISLAAALAIPGETVDGDPLEGRDLILVIVVVVILVTTLVQGLTLPLVVRWARLPEDPTEGEEIALAERTATEAGLAALDERARELGAPEEVVTRVRESYEERLRHVRDEDVGDEIDLLRAEEDLRARLLEDKRAAVVALRDEHRIDDTVLRRIQSRLDLEEVRLTDPPEED